MQRVIQAVQRLVKAFSVGPAVLLVEDDRADADLMMRTLEDYGCSIDYCPTPQMAIDHLRSPAYSTDIVFLDLRFAGSLGGIDVLRVIKQIRCEAPVVL